MSEDATDAEQMSGLGVSEGPALAITSEANMACYKAASGDRLQMAYCVEKLGSWIFC
jgi:hypothetical protein